MISKIVEEGAFSIGLNRSPHTLPWYPIGPVCYIVDELARMSVKSQCVNVCY